jgi:hypothetical protein
LKEPLWQEILLNPVCLDGVEAGGVNWIPYVVLLPVPLLACAVIHTVRAEDTDARVALNETDEAPAFT